MVAFSSVFSVCIQVPDFLLFVLFQRAQVKLGNPAKSASGSQCFDNRSQTPFAAISSQPRGPAKAYRGKDKREDCHARLSLVTGYFKLGMSAWECLDGAPPHRLLYL